MQKEEEIEIRKAKHHNLKEISLDLKRGELIVFTGVSGSGKTSLAFDTIYVEGQRRYIESLSAQVRRLLGGLPKPEVEKVLGIPPTIAIEQKSTPKNPRSTVGTMTGIYDYLRVLYARLSIAYCPITGERVTPTSRASIQEAILKKKPGETWWLLAPFTKSKKGECVEEFEDLLKKGFHRVRVNGTLYNLSDEVPALQKNLAHTIDIVIDRITIDPKEVQRLTEAVETGLDVGKGLLILFHPDTKEEELFSEHGYSAKADTYYPPLEPDDFSFNHPKGMCATCHGLGYVQDFDLSLVLDPKKSIREDCCAVAGSYNTVRWGNIYNQLAKNYRFSVDVPFEKLSKEAQDIFLYGITEKWLKVNFVHPNTGSRWTDYVSWKGVLHEAKKRLQDASSAAYRTKMESLMTEMSCASCKGSRLKPYPSEAQFFDKKIFELMELPISELLAFFGKISMSKKELAIGEEMVKEVYDHLSFLYNVGLHYLTLSRSSNTLSGGEAQRVRLASGVGFGLVSTAYILDEPSIGLHHRDNDLLIKSLLALRDKGNTVIVIEHDEEMVKSADTIVDIGPLAGVRGGELLAIGDLETIKNEKRSLTGAYLSKRLTIPIPKKRVADKKALLTIRGACHNNLKNVDASFPLGLFTCITGVSGSGKSSLVVDILYPLLSNHFHDSNLKVGKFKAIEGLEHLDKVIAIDQSPIGRTSRSNPATYTKVLDDIRDLYASLSESKAFGYTKGRFSFNVREGSCPFCAGMGSLAIDMDFLEDESISCPECKGARFDPKTLSVRFKGKNIFDVLEMAIEEAYTFFQDIPAIEKKLKFLVEVGLGYLSLGQPSTTLSGGEAQRIKLAKELIRPATGRTLYLLDEPTTGLHWHDINTLLPLLQRLVDKKNTLIVIEHNLDLIKTADFIIDLGPEGGQGGGEIVGTGTPERIAKLDTPTGRALKEVFSEKERILHHPVPTKKESFIRVKKASQNNLKAVSAEIPRGAISVFTGPSGSGKTSLAFETIYAEGQRRYIDSLSSYVRQFVEALPRPKVEEVDGLSPAIALEQKRQQTNPRSTLGTLTEVYDYLRIIYTRLGVAYCPETKEKITSITAQYVLDRIFTYPVDTPIQILAPVEVKRGEPFSKFQEKLQNDGYLRVRLNNVYYELDTEIPFDPHRKNSLLLVIDRVTIEKKSEKRILTAIEEASSLANRTVLIALPDKDLFFNLNFAVESTGKTYPTLSPQTFSFNRPEGMCLECSGLGVRYGVSLDTTAALLKSTIPELLERLLKNYFDDDTSDLLCRLLEKEGLPLDLPIKQFTKEQKELLFEGALKGKELEGISLRWLGLHSMLLRIAKMGKRDLREPLLPLLKEYDCASCEGSRLNPLASRVEVNGVTLPKLTKMALTEVLAFIQGCKGSKVLQEALETVKARLSLLITLGLSYLSLERKAPTLSSGEIQRTRLAKQLGSGLTGVLYVLDEPTISLHPYNNALLLTALNQLKDLGNTLILVEHDKEIILASDLVFDFGPGAGHLGGHITASGTPKELMKDPHSLTGAYLSGKKKVEAPVKRRPLSEFFFIDNASKHNIENLSCQIPKRALTCVTGVSGAGKSTLVHDILAPALLENTRKRTPKESFTTESASFREVHGFENLIILDPSFGEQTNRSDVVTYVDLLTSLRYFFASLPAAVTHGLFPKHFSFNHKSGMCKTCRGLGYQIVELQFLPPAKVACDACHGLRLNPASLLVTYKGKNLGQILQLTVDQAKEFLPPIPKIHRLLKEIQNVGLGYLTLGQETQSLSGGEFGRLHLTKELVKRSQGNTLYLLDEPTIGLHFEDIQKLLPIFHALVDKGNTVLLIEHNLDVIKNADYILDLGPEGGSLGGKLIASGTPEEVAKNKASHTGRYLKPLLTK